MSSQITETPNQPSKSKLHTFLTVRGLLPLMSNLKHLDCNYIFYFFFLYKVVVEKHLFVFSIYMLKTQSYNLGTNHY